MIGVVFPDGRLLLGPRIFRAALGRAGVRTDKQEGDGATPAGSLPLRRVLYRADRVRPPDCAVPTEPIAPDDGWCDDPASPAYNQMVRLPFGGSHEVLWRTDEVYDVIGVLGWNDEPARPGRGSAIFLHIARPNYAPTEGCLALSRPDLLAALVAGLAGLDVRAG